MSWCQMASDKKMRPLEHPTGRDCAQPLIALGTGHWLMPTVVAFGKLDERCAVSSSSDCTVISRPAWTGWSIRLCQLLWANQDVT